MSHNFFILNEVEECKYEYPNKVYEVPVQTNFLHHFIVSSAVVNTGNRIIINQEVQHHTTEYVETVESSNEEEEIGKILRAILVSFQ
jgi:hypothetical protein